MIVEILQILFSGLCVGLASSVTVGPVAVLCIQRTLSKGHLAGMISGLGIACADTIMAILAFTVYALLKSYIDEYSTAIQLCGGVFVVIVLAALCYTYSSDGEADILTSYAFGSMGAMAVFLFYFFTCCLTGSFTLEVFPGWDQLVTDVSEVVETDDLLDYLHCKTCDITVEFEEDLVYCSKCGEKLTLIAMDTSVIDSLGSVCEDCNLFFPVNAGFAYCPSCAKQLVPVLSGWYDDADPVEGHVDSNTVVEGDSIVIGSIMIGSTDSVVVDGSSGG